MCFIVTKRGRDAGPPDYSRDHCLFRRPDRLYYRLRKTVVQEKVAMGNSPVEYIVVGIITLVVIIYLIIALLAPEKF